MLTRNKVALFHAGPLAMYVRKTANMLNPIREYIPELAVPMTKGIEAPDGCATTRAGAPYSVIWVTGRPTVFRKTYEIWELRVATVVPAMETISEGGGVKKKRNPMGNARTRNVLVLNSNSMRPAVKMGRERR